MNRDSRVIEIELEKLVPNRFQPRKVFEDDISELAESIRAHGVLQPITVRPLGEKYEIIMGERRYRACAKLGLPKIPAMIVEMNDREAMEVALIENLLQCLLQDPSSQDICILLHFATLTGDAIPHP